MTAYLIVESRDPFDSADVGSFLELVGGLAEAGHSVTLFLVQNGVLAARHGVRAPALSALAAGGVELLADEFSLRERGISANRLLAGVTAAPLDIVIDRLADGCKAIWH